MLLAFVILLALLADCNAAGVTYSEAWGYDRANVVDIGPDNWKSLSGLCDGTRGDAQQSPINIDSAYTTYQANGPLSFTFNAVQGIDASSPVAGKYNLDSGVCTAAGVCTNLPLVNGGWSYQATIPTNAVRVTGGHLGSQSFFLNNVHMHRISEHTIDGGHNEVEFHLVMMNVAACPWFACNDQPAIGGCNPATDSTCCSGQLTCTDFCAQFGNPQCAYPKNDPHSLAIMSLHFMEVDGAPDHPFLTPVVDAIDVSPDNMRIENAATSSTPDTNGFEFISSPFDFSFLNNADLTTYYHYSGGITIPPCVEVVQWTVFESIQPANGVQLQTFLGNFPQEDFRPIQPLNGRIVYTNNAARNPNAPPPSPPSEQPPASSNGEGKGNNHVSDGGVVGIAIGCFVAGSILFGGLAWSMRRSHDRIITPDGSQRGSNEVKIN